MEWIKVRVWQLGIAIMFALTGAVIIYLAGTDEVNQTLLWIGLILFLIAMAVPLIAKIFEAVQEAQGEEGET